MILYRALRTILRGAVQIFFVEIEAEDAERVPAAGPVIFAANHPNSIMDTVILGTQIDRQIHYMARSGLFENPLVALLFDRCGVIPVYRSQDVRSDDGAAAASSGNDQAFRAAFEVLARGDCLGIFPEGRNAPERHVRELKTGTARIALGAEAAHGNRLGVRIVPVGLNFEDRDRFLSSVLVRFAEPIAVADYLDLHTRDPHAAARALTDEIGNRLRAAAVHIAEERSIELVEDIHRIYRRALTEALELAAHNRPELHSAYLDKLRANPRHRPGLDDEFYLKQRIGDALEFFSARDPARVEAIRRRVRAFREQLAEIRMRLDFLDRPPETLSNRRESLKLTLYAVGLAPLFAWGLVNNVVPFLATRAIALRAPDEAMRAFTGLIAGILAFGLAYTLQAWGVWRLSGSVGLVVVYLLTLIPSGLFALSYRRQVARRRDRIVVRTLFMTRRAMMERLVAMRAALLDDLEALREEFMQAESDKRELERV